MKLWLIEAKRFINKIVYNNIEYQFSHQNILIMRRNNFSRRDFLKKSVVASGVVLAQGSLTGANKNITKNEPQRLPREIIIATVSQEGLQAEGPMEMNDQILKILRENVPIYNPDIICLPEIFPFVNNKKEVIDLKKRVNFSSVIVEQIRDFAKQINSYIICPLYTSENNKVFNAAVVIDRKGNILGEYRKIHTTLDEMKNGVSPGSFDQPVFKTDFGVIGIQICFDIEYEDGWKELRDKGVDIIFWPSAFSGGQMISTKAWENRCVTVSSAWKDTSRICDITGEIIGETGRWNINFISGTVNLEKAFIHTWPAVNQFDSIKKKYGRKIHLRTYHEEEWSIIESLSPEIYVDDILNEFDVKSRHQLLKDAEYLQNKLR